MSPAGLAATEGSAIGPSAVAGRVPMERDG